MTIDYFTHTPLSLKPLDVNLWKLDKHLNVLVSQPAGKGYRFAIGEGFITNLRSGSDLMNPLIPRCGGEELSVCWILHDALYTWHDSERMQHFHYMERKDADALLEAMLRKEGTLSNLKIWAIMKALAMFGGYAYQEANKGLYEANGGKLMMDVVG